MSNPNGVTTFGPIFRIDAILVIANSLTKLIRFCLFLKSLATFGLFDLFDVL